MLLFSLVIASFISCNKDEFKDSSTESPSTKRIAAAPIQTTLTPLILSKDADFKSLNVILNNYATKSDNLSVANALIAKKL